MSFGFLSLLPPLLAIALAVKTKKVIPSLFLGIFLGATILAGWNPILGFKKTFMGFIVPNVSDSFSALMIIMLALTGGFISLLSASGGLKKIVIKLRDKISSRKQAQSAVFGGGILTFFSQTASTMLLGPVLQPLTDKFKVAREKLAFLLDTTASSVCSLFPFAAWGAFMIGIISKGFKKAGISGSDLQVFFRTLPFRFHSILLVAAAGLVAFWDLEFGSLKEAQKRSEEKGEVLREGAKPLRKESGSVFEGISPNIWNFILPFVALMASMTAMMVKTGGKGLPSILIGWAVGTFTLIGMLLFEGAEFGKIWDKWLEGVSNMTFVIVVLVLAWSIGSVTSEMKTAKFITGIIGKSLPTAIVPLMVFLVGSFISFSIGTSWGTWGILGPIVIPLANQLGAPIVSSVAALFCSGIFGDNASPISDSSVQASAGSACDHMDHINTQLPIIVVVAAVSSFGFLLSGLFQNPIVILPLVAVLGLVMFILNKRGSK